MAPSTEEPPKNNEIDRLTNSIDSLDPTSASQSPMRTDQSPREQSVEDGHEPGGRIRQDAEGSRKEAAAANDQTDHHHHHLYDEPPIRLVFLDFEVEEELRFGLTELCNHSVRNNMNMVSLLNPSNPPPLLGRNQNPLADAIDLNALELHAQSITHSRLASDLRSPKSSNLPPQLPSSLFPHNPALNLLPNRLQPEFWWFLQFIKQKGEEEVGGEGEGEGRRAGGLEISTSHPNFHEFSNSHPRYLVEVVNRIRSGGGQGGMERFVVRIRYGALSEAFRAVGHVLGLTRHYRTSYTHTHPPTKMGAQKSAPHSFPSRWDSKACAHLVSQFLAHSARPCRFDSLGLMVDCSRNGVLKVQRVHELCRFLALMGLNLLQLYTEDTYQIKGEPFFGYFRGPYTQQELKEIDDYAHALGIEVVACIQTLGHLGQMLQWPRFGGMRDTHDVLLVGSQEVYGFIEKMIRAITSPLRSKKIHIGMDEAHGVSEGRYRQLFGHKDSCQVFTDHLNKVNQICAKLGLRPMIWSDMLFCLAAKNNSLGGYYDSSNPATPELVQSIPPEIELVYWDYYHTTSAPYINKINQHRDLNFKSPAMASGIWTWSRFWTALPFTIETITASMRAIKNPQSGVKHALTTIWGDEGNECDIWSALPGILFYAEHAYSNKSEIDVGLLKSKFDGICGGSFDDFVFASKLDDLQPENQLIDDKARFTPNLSKWLIWEEPFFSILSPQYAGYDLETHYNQLSRYLDEAMGGGGGRGGGGLENGEKNGNGEEWRRTMAHPMNGRLMLPKLIAKVLGLKCHLRDRLVHAYRQNDREELVALAGPGPESRLSRLRALCDETWKYHRELWMMMYKPFGWEVLDLRYGGLRARLESMHERLMGYLDPANEAVERVEELEVETELVYPTSGAVMMLGNKLI
ncbi:hypothetical protein PGT21_016472 [Puccinia graminis f. sp. tritici]|uniref:beta-N-acetylhexosaminidase n=1 Tax=Puccinia graminis f. sp. tritici TaxID=56615 RepID=A0A5B0MRD8_PUCGR|nr:hypothetical protein PGT21_016472 [Puccinia graminis f. sp. tritici]